MFPLNDFQCQTIGGSSRHGLQEANKNPPETAASASLQCAPVRVGLQSLSGPAGGIEDQLRQQKAISYPLGLQAEEGLTSSPAEPEGLKSQGYPLAVFSNNFSSAGQDEKPPSPR